jgi:hypothetical protein
MHLVHACALMVGGIDLAFLPTLPYQPTSSDIWTAIRPSDMGLAVDLSEMEPGSAHHKGERSIRESWLLHVPGYANSAPHEDSRTCVPCDACHFGLQQCVTVHHLAGGCSSYGARARRSQSSPVGSDCAGGIPGTSTVCRAVDKETTSELMN